MPESMIRLMIVLAAWVAVVVLVHAVIVPWLARGPGRDPVNGILWRLVRVLARLVHRLRRDGVEVLPPDEDHGGLVIVSNHTGAVDPLLIQSVCTFHIRWMMAADMMSSGLDWLWRHQALIAVDRDGTDSGPLREAIRHVRAGGAIGIFPEGRIVDAPEEVWPFHPGVGLIVARTRAPVFLFWVSGTPRAHTMAGSVATPSDARVVCLGPLHYDDEREPAQIAADLRRRLAEMSGWRAVDSIPPRREESRLDPFAA
jgi:1-acyl-sn-glycerol-3-phosphate acyltransferase